MLRFIEQPEQPCVPGSGSKLLAVRAVASILEGEPVARPRELQQIADLLQPCPADDLATGGPDDVRRHVNIALSIRWLRHSSPPAGRCRYRPDGDPIMRRGR